MVLGDRLVPPKRQATRRHFVTQVGERSKLRPPMATVPRSVRRTAVAWVQQVSLAATLPFATQVDAPLDLHLAVDLERPFGMAQGVRRVQPATTDDEMLQGLQTISSRSRKIALIYLKEQKKLEPKVQRRYQSVPHAPSIPPLRLQS